MDTCNVVQEKVIQAERTLSPGDEGSTTADLPRVVTFVFEDTLFKIFTPPFALCHCFRPIC